MNSHEIDYRIYGEEMQYVEIELDPNEGVIAEAGSFMMMDDGIKMETIFGDGSQKDQGFLGKVFGAGKRLLTGESLFMTAFYNVLHGKRNVSFASPYPGKIIPGQNENLMEMIDITPTLLEACELDLDNGIQGHSMWSDLISNPFAD